MHIWVDADACPKPVKEILFRAATKREVMVTLVANQPLYTPPSKYIQTVQVSAGFDVADNEIVKRVEHGDLVVTADIPLASEVIEKQGIALNPRGELYTPENIRERLNMRDFMSELRDTGIQTGGHASYGNREKQAFANQLDRLLANVS